MIYLKILLIVSAVIFSTRGMAQSNEEEIKQRAAREKALEYYKSLEKSKKSPNGIHWREMGAYIDKFCQNEKPFKILVRIDEEFTFQSFIDKCKTCDPVLASDQNAEKIFFIFLKEYNRHWLVMKKNQLISLGPRDTIGGCKYIWLLNRKAMLLEEQERFNNEGGTITLDLKRVFEDGNVTFGSLNITSTRDGQSTEDITVTIKICNSYKQTLLLVTHVTQSRDRFHD